MCGRDSDEDIAKEPEVILNPIKEGVSRYFNSTNNR